MFRDKFITYEELIKVNQVLGNNFKTMNLYCLSFFYA